MDASRPKFAHRRLPTVKRCLFAVVPLLVLLSLVELAVRGLVSESSVAQRFEQIEQIIVFLGNEPGQSLFEPDPRCFWRLKPNVVAPVERGNWWGGVMSNSHGMRSREISVEEARDKRRVLCLGDSTTFAFGVDFADAWPNQLQTLLDQDSAAGRLGLRPDLDANSPARDGVPSYVEVLNAGIPGQTSYQGRQRLAAELAKWRPHLTVITFGNNDGWRWDGFADKEHAMPETPSALGWMDHSRAWRWLRSLRLQAARQQAKESEASWAEQASWNYFDPNTNWTPRVSLEDFADNLRAMIAMCHQYDGDVMLIVWPDQRQLLNQSTWRLPYQETTRQVAAETGIACVDLVPPFELAGRWGVDRFLPQDVIHVDRAGNQLVAKAVAPYVRRLPRSGDMAQTIPLEAR